MDQDRRILDPRQPADAGADQNASAATLLLGLRLPSRIGDRLLGGGKTEGDEIIDPPLFLGIDPLIGIETAVAAIATRNIAGDFGRQIVRAEFGDRPRAGFAGEKARPGFFNTASKRCDEAKASDNDTTHGDMDRSRRSGL